MKYIFKNLCLFFKHQKLIFFLMVMCAVISGVMINFSFGLYCNYETKKNSLDFERTNLRIGFSHHVEKGKFVDKEVLEKCLMQFSDNLNDKVSCFFVVAKIDNLFDTECRFVIKDGSYGISKVFRDNMFLQDFMDSYFTEQQEKSGEKVVFMYDMEKWDNTHPITDSLMIKPGFLHMQGKEFQIIGTQSWLSDLPLMTFSSLDDNTILDEWGLSIDFSEAITKAQYEEIVDVMIKELGNMAVIPPMKAIEQSVISFYNTMIIISVLISIVIAINISILYQYILMQRKKELAIFMICGMNKYQVIFNYIAECFSLMMPSYFLGMLFYLGIIYPNVLSIFPYMEGVYTIKVYVLLFAVYFIVSTIVLGSVIVKFVTYKSISQRLKKGG